MIVEGKTGLLVPPGDISALTTALGSLRENATFRSQMGQAAQQRVNQEFTDTQMAQRYAQLWGGVLHPDVISSAPLSWRRQAPKKL